MGLNPEPASPITAIRGTPPLDHNHHNIYWVSEGAITMRSQFLLDLSDSPCTKPSIHAASRDFDLIISATIPASSQFLKDLADRVFYLSDHPTCPASPWLTGSPALSRPPVDHPMINTRSTQNLKDLRDSTPDQPMG